MRIKSIVFIVLVLTVCVSASAQGERRAKDEEVLTPLTEEEQAINPRDIILNQPDFSADLTYFVAERFGGHGFSQRLVRKGNRYREESEFWVFIGELGKPSARLFPKVKKYDGFEAAKGGSADTTPINPQALAQEENVTFKALGTRLIDGHHCIKIEATRNGKPEKFYFYAARDLKNLVIVAQIIEPTRSTIQRLANVSFEVPDNLVQIPPDYESIEHDRWVKLENARVTYKGKASKDFAVFRAPGGELFLHLGEGLFPWHYLIRPQQATVETAFQGMIVNRAGQFIWETKDTEGFSQTWYRVPKSSDRKPAGIKPNSVTFRSIDYDKDKAMIEVRW